MTKIQTEARNPAGVAHPVRAVVVAVAAAAAAAAVAAAAVAAILNRRMSQWGALVRMTPDQLHHDRSKRHLCRNRFLAILFLCNRLI